MHHIFKTLAAGKGEDAVRGAAPRQRRRLHGRGLHSSVSFAQHKHFLWDTQVGVNLSVTKTAQVELKPGRV
jgi:hypothetical protein